MARPELEQSCHLQLQRGAGTSLPLLIPLLAGTETASNQGMSCPLLSLWPCITVLSFQKEPTCQSPALKLRGCVPVPAVRDKSLYLWLQPKFRVQELCVGLTSTENSTAAKPFPGSFDVPPVALKDCQMLCCVISNCCSTKDLNPSNYSFLQEKVELCFCFLQITYTD